MKAKLPLVGGILLNQQSVHIAQMYMWLHLVADVYNQSALC